MKAYEVKPTQNVSHLKMLVRYMAWANEITFKAVLSLPDDEITKIRPTHFKTILSTLNHIYVINDVFRAHLEGQKHNYSARNTATSPPINELWDAFQKMDVRYIKITDELSDKELEQRIKFEFVDGGYGDMTRHEILSHIINHATYHRGFVSDMLNQANISPEASDLPVFLRDVWN